MSTFSIESQFSDIKKQIKDAEENLHRLKNIQNSLLSNVRFSIMFGALQGYFTPKFEIIDIKNGIVKYKYYTKYGNEEDGPFYGKIPLKHCETSKTVESYYKNREYRRNKIIDWLRLRELENTKKEMEVQEFELYQQLKEKFESQKENIDE